MKLISSIVFEFSEEIIKEGGKREEGGKSRTQDIKLQGENRAHRGRSLDPFRAQIPSCC